MFLMLDDISGNVMLYYIHGYRSSPDGDKGRLFGDALNAKAIKYRDCEPDELVISNCLERIANEIKDDKDAILIGSSLGGFLAASTAVNHSNVKKLILLNPAVIPPSTNVINFSDAPTRIIDEMRDERLFENKIDAEITILMGMKDKVIPLEWILKFAKAQEATIRLLKDDHRFTHNLRRLPDIISEILEE